MQVKQLTKLSRLHKSDLRLIKNLVDLCAQHDGFRLRVYWNILQNRLTEELNDIFYFVDGNMVGYLALFAFEVDEVEISLIVHPKYRGRGIAKKLMAEALLELQQRRIPKMVWICPKGSVIDRNYLEALQAEYIFSQIEMTTTQIPIIRGLPVVQLREAKVEDLPLIADMGAVSFSAVYAAVLQRFTENMREKSRRIWLLSTPEGLDVGKIHVRLDEGGVAFIHDLCILPQYRGRKLAIAMLLQTMALLHKNGQRVFTLDVETDNEVALQLYLQCGYQVVATYHYWRVAVANLIRIVQ